MRPCVHTRKGQITFLLAMYGGSRALQEGTVGTWECGELTNGGAKDCGTPSPCANRVGCSTKRKEEETPGLSLSEERGAGTKYTVAMTHTPSVGGDSSRA